MASLRDIGERPLIGNIIKRMRRPPGLGPGDDAALVEIGNENIVVATDSVTFKGHMPACMSHKAFGWMSAAVNLSDLGSMGARPVALFSSLLMPPDIDEFRVYEIMDGMDECAEAFGAFVYGGDTKEGEGAVSVTAIGVMEGRKAMTRSGAMPGDIVAVTGPLGSAAAGYYALEHGVNDVSVNALERPMPRVNEGIILSECGATSCMDISDGLSSAMNGICGNGGTGMDVSWESVPAGAGVERMSEFVSKEHMMLDFGGDYELLFTIPEDGMRSLRERGVTFTAIGTVSRSGKPVLIKDGKRTDVTDSGYQHFKDRS